MLDDIHILALIKFYLQAYSVIATELKSPSTSCGCQQAKKIQVQMKTGLFNCHKDWRNTFTLPAFLGICLFFLQCTAVLRIRYLQSLNLQKKKLLLLLIFGLFYWSVTSNITKRQILMQLRHMFLQMQIITEQSIYWAADKMSLQWFHSWRTPHHPRWLTKIMNLLQKKAAIFLCFLKVPNGW